MYTKRALYIESFKMSDIMMSNLKKPCLHWRQGFSLWLFSQTLLFLNQSTNGDLALFQVIFSSIFDGNQQ